MVWIGISLDVATELVVLVRRNLNANRYSTNILEPVVVPYTPLLGTKNNVPGIETTRCVGPPCFDHYRVKYFYLSNRGNI
jgi:hypothetical protein